MLKNCSFVEDMRQLKKIPSLVTRNEQFVLLPTFDNNNNNLY